MHITYANNLKDLEGILQLQHANHKDNLPDTQAREDGFVTLKHDLDLLKKMQAITPQIIAKEEDQVVGYALTLPPILEKRIPILAPLFQVFDNIDYQGKPISAHNYYIMGQICIDRNYRGQGIFQALYAAHKSFLKDQFDLCVTEISVNNPRSMRAHAKVGFQEVCRFEDETDHWSVVVLEL